jgi:dipeptidyl aminopeptidase/acylaminoacyl peptidase
LPAWRAFDQDTGRFLFSRWPFTPEGEVPEDMSRQVRTMRVLAPGSKTPVATIHCLEQCNWLHSFGPGRDEVTTLVSPGMRGRLRMAQVWGFDGELRDVIDLSGVLYGRGVADLEWSPDGSRLAVSTFWGASEPDCPGETPTRAGVPNDGRVYLFDRAGGDPELVYRQRAQRPQEWPPVLTNLAWSPDGNRLGLVSSTYCHYKQPDSPTLLALDVESGQAQTLHQLDDDPYDDYQLPTFGFAWSADGTRIAVTSGTGIA